MKYISIAVDGPSASGKSSVCKGLSKKLNFVHLSSGSIYRAIGLYILENGITTQTFKISDLDKIKIEIKFKENNQLVFLNGRDVTNILNTEEISKSSTEFAGIYEIREFVKNIQQNLAKSNNIIIDGRDITSVVLPNANFKFYLTANKKVRAKRRYLDYKQKGVKISFNEVYNSLSERDNVNANRSYGKLIKTKDSILINSSKLSLEETINIMYNIIKSGMH